ncbi:hypothetical protein PFICI_11821 [Pestalotiopsis fici W106-1]|uniref:Carboxypeptidase n=1 Tax=Pestalotiopsis fici (strain W106-1 / CGMCC3.15140) TaxID=1229662 RepID=W3WRG7_PESFW|nr:uncharacterized protein PFICI_11821 [Pestalotiopsis fici W106-1]ETS76434.1 hypothetical protein PFICI_11821 [Pestalotiopsis fici W106-1]
MRSQSIVWFATAATATLLPAQTSFSSQHGLPPFSVQLSPDTAAVCNSSTPGTAGWIDSDDDSHMFFWLYESKNNPTSDPVILFMSGGPGGSSTGAGALMELGPCQISSDGEHTLDNPYGWNANATLLFIDQPLTVGYSYGGRMPRNLKDATTNTHRFLQQFFVAFEQLSELDFYITGESYGGSWVPALGARIVERQQSDLAMVIQSSTGYMPKHINLKGIAVGNGLFRQSVQSSGLFESACKGPDAIFNPAQCDRLEPLASRCEILESVCEEFGYDSVGCKTAASVCGVFFEVFAELGRNPYDWRQRCSGDVLTCYSSLRGIETLMALNDTRKALGVPDQVSYALLSEEVITAWNEEDEIWKPSHQYVNYLLDMDVRVLIYVGNTDFLCQYGGMRRLVNEGLSWHHQPSFRYRPLREWYVDGQRAGLGKAIEPLSYMEVEQSGHLVPFDKPVEALAMINSWIQRSLPW